ncbi:MAG: hypothetical protein U0704_11735 [Candidatus Eisenbacteria bacterium]
MKPVEQAFEHEWTWNRPSVGRRHWELRSGDDLVATLDQVSLLGSRMAAATAAGARELRHEGWLRGRIRLTDAEGATIAVFQPSWFGRGRLELAGGGALEWARADFWGRRWAFRDANGLDQVRFVRRPSWFRSTTTVEVSDAGRQRPELADLTLVGFYLLLMMQRQAHAAH